MVSAGLIAKTQDDAKIFLGLGWILMGKLDEIVCIDPKWNFSEAVVFDSFLVSRRVEVKQGVVEFEVFANDMGLIVDSGERMNGGENICPKDKHIFILRIGKSVRTIEKRVYASFLQDLRGFFLYNCVEVVIRNGKKAFYFLLFLHPLFLHIFYINWHRLSSFRTF